jgi:hypothetical protein
MLAIFYFYIQSMKAEAIPLSLEMHESLNFFTAIQAFEQFRLVLHQ